MSFPNGLNVVEPKRIGSYILRGTVGDGAFSVVKLVCHEQTHQYYACKIVPRSRIATESLQARFEAEIRINQQLHHPGIVHLFDMLKDENNYYIIMEFCPNGELFQYIVDRNHLSEEEAKPFVRQILETLDYIHKMGISHRDMKPENLLMDQMGRVKFSDFGLSRFIPSNGLVDTPCGSPCYASPECISGKPYNGKTTDVWSFGVILYAMLTGQLPWTKRNQQQLFAQIKRGEYTIPSFLSDNAREFVKGLMTVDISKRLTIEQALNHKWLEGVPAQFTSYATPHTIVSLRAVDKFFLKELEEEELSKHGLKREKSTEWNLARTSKLMRLVAAVSGGGGGDASLPYPAVSASNKFLKKPQPTKPASRAKVNPSTSGSLKARTITAQGARKPAGNVKASSSMLKKVVAKPNITKRTVH